MDTRGVFELLPDALLVVNSEGDIEHANSGAVALLKLPCPLPPGVNLLPLTADLADAVKSFLRSCSRSSGLLPGSLTLRSDPPVFCRVQGALLNRASSPGPSRILLRLFPKSRPDQFSELSNQIQILGREITRRRQAEADLVRADQKKDEFLAMLGHELRNPMAPLANAIQLVEIAVTRDGGLAPGTGQPLVSLMKRQMAQLSRLVDDLLDVARITHGGLRIETAPAPLLTVLESAIEAAAPDIVQRDQRLIKELAPGASIIQADTARLSQVFVNLLCNAAKFTPRGGTIQLSANMTPTEAVIRVADNGIGIDEKLLTQLFRPFVQGEQSLSRSNAGLGIGLAVAKEIVDKHGGTILAESPGAGFGSVFTVRLPFLSMQGGPSSKEEPNWSRPAARPRMVLIVDDNVDAAKSMELLLSISGHTVKVAHDSESALAQLDNFRPDLCLMDIGLPGMDGYELASAVRGRSDMKNVCLIALTGYGQEEDRKKAVRSGFDMHFTKPVDYQAIENALERLE